MYEELTELQARHAQTVLDHYEGCCMPSLDPEDYGMDEEDVEAILIHHDVNTCVVCGWWLFAGEYCTMHDHEEITCEQCCEYEDA